MTADNLQIFSSDFEDGEEIPKKCGYMHGNVEPSINVDGTDGPQGSSYALIMDDPDAMAAVGKVWVHWLEYRSPEVDGDKNVNIIKWGRGKNDFDVLGYGGPAPPDKRHTYVFTLYDLDTRLNLKNGFSRQELEDAMKGHIIAEAKLTGTFAP